MFKTAHEKWIQQHRKKRIGERRRRLEDGHDYGEQLFCEKIWWPLFGNFDFLHPEFETIDFNEGCRFIDFAYVRAGIKIAIEIDGFGPHAKNLSRRQFSNQLLRQMHLTNDGWTVVRISVDDLTDRPRVWQQQLQQLIGRYFSESPSIPVLNNVLENAVMRLAFRSQSSFKIADVTSILQCNRKKAREIIRQLELKKLLTPACKGTIRQHKWKINENFRQLGAVMNEEKLIKGLKGRPVRQTG